MARMVRDAAIGTRQARLKLKLGRRYWRGIHEGLALGYRRGKQGSGAWCARLMLSDGTYALRALKTADDHAPANGEDVLTFAQAQQAAIELGEAVKRDEGTLTRKVVTLADAADDYMAWFRQNRRSARETEGAIKAHILPALGARPLATLTTQVICGWHEALAAQPAKLRTGRFAGKANLRAPAATDDERRARRATANRVLTVLKAILNRAFQHGLVADDTQWRRAKPFGKVDEPRIRFLTDAEAVRLVNACPSDLRRLVRGALLAGARFGELVTMRAQDFDALSGRVYVATSKSGHPRHIPLNPEGAALFRELTTGKTGDALLFVKADGSAWGKNHHVRALAEACKVAKVRPAVAFHELRHTFASHLAQAGVDLLAISKLLGHADTRITSRHYAHLADKTLADAVLKLPSFGTEAVLQAVPATPRRKAAR